MGRAVAFQDSQKIIVVFSFFMVLIILKDNVLLLVYKC